VLVFRKCGRQRALPITKAPGKKAATLKRLRAFLDAEEPQTVRWLMSNWQNQQNTVTYKELREVVLSGGMSQKQLDKWQKDYAKLVNEKLAPQWQKAMTAAAEARKAEFPYFLYDPSVGAAQAYIQQHGAQLITNLVATQRDAIQAMVAQAAHYDAITADSLALMIRPVIGLTKPQSAANLHYYNAMLDALKKDHPRMTTASAEKKAREAAAKYAGRQHRYRAMNIARTELAAAYNQGGYGATKDAQAQGYIGDCNKVWLTADDERVCHRCGGIDGKKVNMDALFSIGVLLPPAHPACRCAVAYEEIAEPVVPTEPTTPAAQQPSLQIGPNNDTINTNAVDNSPPDPIGQMLGIGTRAIDETDALKGTNPNYALGWKYQNNCQRCVPAYELRRRGYDVTAKPKPL
jgi:SPP1 gp7 family putative phage head morphogenesis protein